MEKIKKIICMLIISIISLFMLTSCAQEPKQQEKLNIKVDSFYREDNRGICHLKIDNYTSRIAEEITIEIGFYDSEDNFLYSEKTTITERINHFTKDISIPFEINSPNASRAKLEAYIVSYDSFFMSHLVSSIMALVFIAIQIIVYLICIQLGIMEEYGIKVFSICYIILGFIGMIVLWSILALSIVDLEIIVVGALISIFVAFATYLGELVFNW